MRHTPLGIPPTLMFKVVAVWHGSLRVKAEKFQIFLCRSLNIKAEVEKTCHKVLVHLSENDMKLLFPVTNKNESFHISDLKFFCCSCKSSLLSSFIWWLHFYTIVILAVVEDEAAALTTEHSRATPITSFILFTYRNNSFEDVLARWDWLRKI